MAEMIKEDCGVCLATVGVYHQQTVGKYAPLRECRLYDLNNVLNGFHISAKNAAEKSGAERKENK